MGIQTADPNRDPLNSFGYHLDFSNDYGTLLIGRLYVVVSTFRNNWSMKLFRTIL